ncbi:MAG TPA: EexN family lipoprotein [Xylella fastidiosa subsp. multiplex]
MRKMSTVLVITAILASCADNNKPVRTVDWYTVYDAEREEMIAKCNNNPGELRESPNCINATSVENRLKPQRDIE